jgi:phosphate transport system protein
MELEFEKSMTEMMKHELEQLKKRVMSLSAMVEDAIRKSLNALLNRDLELARKVIEADDAIDRMEIEVEDMCLKILALQQPVASDLRLVIAILKVNEALERMGDIASNISRRSIVLSRFPKFTITDEVPEMAAKAQSMVKESIDCLVNRDTQLARKICNEDDNLDDIRERMHQKILQQIRRGPEDIDGWMALFTIVRHLERLGDMAVVVAQDVIYLVEGDIIRHRGVK